MRNVSKTYVMDIETVRKGGGGVLGTKGVNWGTFLEGRMGRQGFRQFYRGYRRHLEADRTFGVKFSLFALFVPIYCGVWIAAVCLALYRVMSDTFLFISLAFQGIGRCQFSIGGPSTNLSMGSIEPLKIKFLFSKKAYTRSNQLIFTVHIHVVPYDKYSYHKLIIFDIFFYLLSFEENCPFTDYPTFENELYSVQKL